jgi:hypothetical protein
MKALVAAMLLSTTLAIGTTACAHQQLSNQQVAKRAVPVVALVALIVLAASYDQSGVDLSGAKF